MTARSSEGLDERRRRLLFRSWHTGIREVDLVMGPFADARIGALSETELDAYETLLGAPSPKLLAWVLGDSEPDAGYDAVLFGALRKFHLNKPKA